MSRKTARELAMKALYQIDIQREDIEEQLSHIVMENELDEKDAAFFNQIVTGVSENKTILDEMIGRNSKSWGIDRMPKVDLAILRLCAFELKYREDIPEKVSINEAVELAKKYCDDKSKSFINGILGKVYEEVTVQSEK